MRTWKMDRTWMMTRASEVNGGTMNQESEYGLLFSRGMLSEVWIDVGRWREGLDTCVNPVGFRPKVGDKLDMGGMILHVAEALPPGDGRGMWKLTCGKPENWKSIWPEAVAPGGVQPVDRKGSPDVIRIRRVDGCRFEMVDATGRRVSIRPTATEFRRHDNLTFTINLQFSTLKETRPRKRSRAAH